MRKRLKNIVKLMSDEQLIREINELMRKMAHCSSIKEIEKIEDLKYECLIELRRRK